MNSGPKKPPGAREVPGKRATATPPQLRKPAVVQPKTIQPPAPRKPPVAPPVYRPQPVPLVLQRKTRPNPLPAAKSMAVQLAEDPGRGRSREREDPGVRQRYHSKDRRYGPGGRSGIGIDESEPLEMPKVEEHKPMVVSSSSVGMSLGFVGSGSGSDKEEEDDGGSPSGSVVLVGMQGFDSRAIYRMMPEFEAAKTLQSGPQANGHFWSPTVSYITGYMKSGGKGSSSSVLIMIPLAVTYFEFLDIAAANKDLQPHNFGAAWNKYFPKRPKGKKGKAALLIKNDGGTPTLVFCKALLPEHLTKLMGKPVEHK